MQPKAAQLELTDKEHEELKTKIVSDWTQDSQDLELRANAMERWTHLWRRASVPNPVPEQEGSNFHIPLVLWQILNAIAKELSALFGDDAEIIVKPRGKADVKNSEKIKKFIEWRVKKSLKLFKKYYDFVTLKRIYGTAIAYLQWTVRKRTIKVLVTKERTIEVPQTDPTTGLRVMVPQTEEYVEEEEREVTEFEGLDFKPENLEDWIVPKTATNLVLGEIDHFIRRLHLTVDEILDLRDQGKLDADIWKDDEEFTDKLYRLAETGKSSTVTPDPGQKTRKAKDELSGQPPTPQGAEDEIVVLNWCGKFRVSKKGKKNERADDLVCFYIPEMQKLVGVCRLVDIFPDGRLAFIKSDNIRDPNRFFSIGYAELLESINNEMDCTHNITTDAGLGSIGPMVFYKPMSGFKAEKFRWEPFMAIPLNDPKNDVVVATIGNVNMAPYIALMPQLLAMAERLTGLTETQLGRQFSGPNAPRTYGQQAMLQAESNQRVFLDLQLERETFSELLHRVWEADKRWLPKPVFFRVAEEDIEMTEDDFQGDFDFDIGPPTSQINRQQATQELLQLYTLALQNPYAMQNPAIILALSRKLLEKLGQPDIAALVPDPEQMAPPQSPEQENVRLLQGEDVDPHPADNHIRHIQVHQGLLDSITQQEQSAPGFAFTFNTAAKKRNIAAHIAEHQEAFKTRGASINMLGRGAPAQAGGMVAGGAQPALPQLGLGMGQGQGPTNPASNPAQAGLAGLLNQGGLNLG